MRLFERDRPPGAVRLRSRDGARAVDRRAEERPAVLSEAEARCRGSHVRVAGLDFPNPLGMAAGYDKNAEVPDALLGLGFGFAEVGTVTPLPQPGNPKPRIFRLAADQAVINRLGFNNEGHERAHQRLRARAGRGGIVGVNIGANKDSADRIGDYEARRPPLCRRRLLSDGQHLLAQHAGPARHAGAPGAGRTAVARHGGAR